MTELNKRSRYKNLWKTLRDKYYPSSIPIYLIEGNYPVACEGGYNWIVGYCTTLIIAERTVLKLKNELREARRYLGPYLKAERILYNEYDKAEKRYASTCPDNLYGYSSIEILPYRNPWIEANNKFTELVELVFSRMTDQNIPFPRSHIMSSSNKDDGPIIYSVRAIYGI